MAGSLVVGDINSVDVGSIQDQVATAWGWIDGSGPTVNHSYNISSVTDNGVGNYLVNFGTTMADINYVLAGSFNDAADVVVRTLGYYNAGKTTTYSNVLTKVDGVLSDGVFHVTFFGGK